MMPSENTLRHAVKFSLDLDKPILMDYWKESFEDNACIGVKENGEKLLVKSADVYTSLIDKTYKVLTDYILVTKNFIYIVSADIKVKRVTCDGESSSSNKTKRTFTNPRASNHKTMKG